MRPNYKLDQNAQNAGFRNFTSFIAICYYEKKMSLKDCGRILKVSHTRVKKSMLKRSFELRASGRLIGSPRPSPPNKIDIGQKVRENTNFIIPEQAFRVMYEEWFLTTYQIGQAVNISQTLVVKKLREYNIAVRNQGTQKIRRDKRGRTELFESKEE